MPRFANKVITLLTEHIYKWWTPKVARNQITASTRIPLCKYNYFFNERFRQVLQHGRLIEIKFSLSAGEANNFYQGNICIVFNKS